MSKPQTPKPPKEMMRVSFDMPASIPIGLFTQLTTMFKAENIETKPIGMPAQPGDMPSRKTGANTRECLIWHFQRRQVLTKPELDNIMLISGFTPSSLNGILPTLIDEKIIRRPSHGTYELRQLALPAPAKGK